MQKKEYTASETFLGFIYYVAHTQSSFLQEVEHSDKNPNLSVENFAEFFKYKKEDAELLYGTILKMSKDKGGIFGPLYEMKNLSAETQILQKLTDNIPEHLGNFFGKYRDTGAFSQLNPSNIQQHLPLLVNILKQMGLKTDKAFENFGRRVGLAADNFGVDKNHCKTMLYWTMFSLKKAKARDLGLQPKPIIEKIVQLTCETNEEAKLKTLN